LKQLHPYPWDDVEAKYPEGSIVRGKVVSITNYGAFVELEKGVEGLIHISEMSWTRHIKHPSKVVAIGDTVDVMVLKIDKESEKISLGLKQTESDPWLTLAERYPVGTVIEGKVRNLTDFGAFVEVEEGIDGLVHISDMSWTKRVRHPKEILRRGDSVGVQILDIDTDKRRISLGIKQLKDNPWPELAVEFPVGHEVGGKITRMLDHGAIVEIDSELEGFVPLGHMGIPKIDKPQYYFKENEEIPLKVIKMDVENRRIVLSIAERLKDMGEETTAEFVTNHPRLEDVVAADLASQEEGDGPEEPDEHADYAEAKDEAYALEAMDKAALPDEAETEPDTPAAEQQTAVEPEAASVTETEAAEDVAAVDSADQGDSSPTETAAPAEVADAEETAAGTESTTENEVTSEKKVEAVTDTAETLPEGDEDTKK
jgi:small subunit ribosomal protein S1